MGRASLVTRYNAATANSQHRVSSCKSSFFIVLLGLLYACLKSRSIKTSAKYLVMGKREPASAAFLSRREQSPSRMMIFWWKRGTCRAASCQWLSVHGRMAAAHAREVCQNRPDACVLEAFNVAALKASLLSSVVDFSELEIRFQESAVYG